MKCLPLGRGSIDKSPFDTENGRRGELRVI